ncbi:carboxyl-terminal processing protease [Winogradskyella epiphytica]|uniref:Carboxyl-terminal processing protease n=1 Tax=Winogradskyella epiphytica TaxID=262005 RepID=A0A2V4XMM3_9FLAO|nr:S41 family peptidase [Winogradskyella epiphytica]PYE83329.1 carboxyl-terminal processing protease [Winogradskyella epiphytica]GGW57386.1 peptidase S41 [Winogradskyella epiphytica]
MKTLLRKKIILPVLALLIFFGTTAFKNDFFEIAKQIEIFTTLYKEINMNYVDETNPGELMDTAIKSMLNDLDPYTQFYNEQDVEASRINNSGDYTGIGAKILTLKDKLVVVEPYKDYAADKAGLKAGDEIIKVDNVTVADFKDDAANLLQGAAGTEVSITYKRQGKTNTIKIIRESLEIKAVPHYSMVDEKTGYIVLRKFNDKASAETISAIRALKNQGATQLILDLRGNPGGLLNEAVNVTNIFVPKNQLVVTTKSKVKKYNKTYYTQRDPIDTEMPLVVLIDGRSASASEIVSGALQDMDRAVVVGTRSFGKGLVQRPKALTYGTQMKITISRYYTPSGRCIQSLDYSDRDESGKAKRTQQENYNVFKTRNGRDVFDGGGVQPDIEVENSKHTPITKAIYNENLIFDFATNYYYNNKVDDLKNFKLSDSEFKKFKNYINTSGFDFETKTEEALQNAIKIAEEEALDDLINTEFKELTKALKSYKTNAIDKNKAQLVDLLTDEIIKRYFYSEGLYTYYSANNTEINRALSILNNPIQYASILR